MKKTLVFGASLNTDRHSNMIIKRLVEKHVEVEAFGLRSGVVHGVKIATVLLPYKDIHTVTLYMNPERQKQYYDYLVSLKPNRVIFNPGTENPEFYHILKENAIDYEVACSLTLLLTDQY